MKSARDTIIRCYAPSLMRAAGCSRADAVLTLAELSSDERDTVVRTIVRARTRGAAETSARARRNRPTS